MGTAWRGGGEMGILDVTAAEAGRAGERLRARGMEWGLEGGLERRGGGSWVG